MRKQIRRFKWTLLAAGVALAAASAAFAKDGCPQYKAVASYLAGSGADDKTVAVRLSQDFVLAYAARLGFPVPQDSEPVGMLIFAPKGYPHVAVAIIERDGGVCYSGKVPLDVHNRVMDYVQGI